MYIDGDTHYWPLRMLDKVSHPGKGFIEIDEDKGGYFAHNGEPYPGRTATFYRDGKKVHAFKEPRWSLDARYAWMDKDGFDVQVLIPDNRPLIYDLEPELGRQMARAHNDTVAEDIQGKQDRFIGVSWVYLPDVQASVREVRRAAEELGLRAVKVMGGWGDVELDSEVLYPFYEEVARLDVPILLHPAARGFAAQDSGDWLVGGSRYQGFPQLPTALGFPLTYMVAAARLIFSGTLDRFPTLRIGMFEGSVGWVPWLRQTLDEHMPDAGGGPDTTRNVFFQGREMLKRRPSEYFSQFYIAATAWEPYLANTVREYPDHQFIIGSDFDHGDAISTWPETVRPIKAMPGLSEQDQERILGGNALELFGLADRRPQTADRRKAATA
jgi:predicted TIM-barrel fold metal-dependent hydrolase